MRVTSITLALCLTLTGCGESEPPPSLTELRADAPVLTIQVLADGSILADSEPTSLDALNNKLPALAESHGLIWFYRDAPDGPPPPAMAKVLDLVLKHELPVCLSVRPGFIDLIEEDTIGSAPTNPHAGGA